MLSDNMDNNDVEVVLSSASPESMLSDISPEDNDTPDSASDIINPASILSTNDDSAVKMHDGPKPHSSYKDVLDLIQEKSEVIDLLAAVNARITTTSPPPPTISPKIA
jgi:hypothetical protein